MKKLSTESVKQPITSSETTFLTKETTSTRSITIREVQAVYGRSANQRSRQKGIQSRSRTSENPVVSPTPPSIPPTET